MPFVFKLIGLDQLKVLLFMPLFHPEDLTINGSKRKGKRHCLGLAFLSLMNGKAIFMAELSFLKMSKTYILLNTDKY